MSCSKCVLEFECATTSENTVAPDLHQRVHVAQGMPHALFVRSGSVLSKLQQLRPVICLEPAVGKLHLNARAAFASAADAATKEGSEAKKEAKKSVVESALSAFKVNHT